MRHPKPYILLLALGGLILGLYACRSAAPPITYYTLDPLPLMESVIQAPSVPAPLRIGLGPVNLPTYLQRTQIVTRSGDHTLAINDFHRWAGPLDEEIMRVLVVAVGEALPGAEVLAYPWGRRHDPTHQIRLTVQRFDGQIGDQVHLRGLWHLTCLTDRSRDVGTTFDIVEPVNSTKIAALVAAQNRALAILTDEIVAALCALP